MLRITKKCNADNVENLTYLSLSIILNHASDEANILPRWIYTSNHPVHTLLAD